jgi:hypothetical protein
MEKTGAFIAKYVIPPLLVGTAATVIIDPTMRTVVGHITAECVTTPGCTETVIAMLQQNLIEIAGTWMTSYVVAQCSLHPTLQIFNKSIRGKF